MANEFKVKNGLIVNGATTITGSVTATTGFTGSLSGTASYALYAVNASVDTSSFATTGSNTFKGAQIFQNNVTIQGTASIAYLSVTYESASIIYSSGSNQLGDATNDTQTIIGTTIVSGSLNVTGSAAFVNGITGSLLGTASTASFVTTAQTASYVLQAVSASYATLAANSTNLNGQAASYYLNASNINAGTLNNSYLPSQISVTGVTASFVGNLTGTASIATTASYVKTAQTASYVNTLNQDVTIGSNNYLSIGANSKTFSAKQLNKSTATTIISVNTSIYTHKAIFVRYVLTTASGTTDMRAGTIMLVSDGNGNVSIAEATTQDVGDTSMVGFTATASGGINEIVMTPSSGNWDVFFDYTLI